MTPSQAEAIEACLTDIRSKKQMRRLLYGEVGSGKTAVAYAVMNSLPKNSQALFLVPTESLAHQQYAALKGYQDRRILGRKKTRTIEFGILTGDSTKTKRGEVLRAIEDGTIDTLVSTHAILHADRAQKFKNLKFVVVDEQQRFGVEQRDVLAKHRNKPHVLILTATPIPRTFLQTILPQSEKLSLSVSRLKPRQQKSEKKEKEKEKEKENKNKKKQRLPLTRVTDTATFFHKEWKRVLDVLGRKKRVFFVFPIIQPGKTDVTKHLFDLVSGTKVIRKLLPKGVRVTTAHGEMKAKEKAKNIQLFRESEKHPVLCSTTCIEVGMDVPEADLIVIFDAERFGVSQLHQLRGRVGRDPQSRGVCILVTETRGCSRVEHMQRLQEGLHLARDDTIKRGPGDLTGTDQKGWEAIEAVDGKRKRDGQRERNIKKRRKKT